MISSTAAAITVDHGKQLPPTVATLVAKMSSQFPHDCLTVSDTARSIGCVATEGYVDHGKQLTQVLATSVAAMPQQFSHDLWTVNETASYLRCEPQTIRKNLSCTGTFHGLKPRRFGRRWYFSATEVRALLGTA